MKTCCIPVARALPAQLDDFKNFSPHYSNCDLLVNFSEQERTGLIFNSLKLCFTNQAAPEIIPLRVNLPQVTVASRIRLSELPSERDYQKIFQYNLDPSVGAAQAINLMWSLLRWLLVDTTKIDANQSAPPRGKIAPSHGRWLSTMSAIFDTQPGVDDKIGLIAFLEALCKTTEAILPPDQFYPVAEYYRLKDAARTQESLQQPLPPDHSVAVAIPNLYQDPATCAPPSTGLLMVHVVSACNKIFKIPKGESSATYWDLMRQMREFRSQFDIRKKSRPTPTVNRISPPSAAVPVRTGSAHSHHSLARMAIQPANHISPPSVAVPVRTGSAHSHHSLARMAMQQSAPSMGPHDIRLNVTIEQQTVPLSITLPESLRTSSYYLNIKMSNAAVTVQNLKDFLFLPDQHPKISTDPSGMKTISVAEGAWKDQSTMTWYVCSVLVNSLIGDTLLELFVPYVTALLDLECRERPPITFSTERINNILDILNPLQCSREKMLAFGTKQQQWRNHLTSYQHDRWESAPQLRPERKQSVSGSPPSPPPRGPHSAPTSPAKPVPQSSGGSVDVIAETLAIIDHYAKKKANDYNLYVFLLRYFVAMVMESASTRSSLLRDVFEQWKIKVHKDERKTFVTIMEAAKRQKTLNTWYLKLEKLSQNSSRTPLEVTAYVTTGQSPLNERLSENVLLYLRHMPPDVKKSNCDTCRGSGTYSAQSCVCEFGIGRLLTIANERFSQSLQPSALGSRAQPGLPAQRVFPTNEPEHLYESIDDTYQQPPRTHSSNPFAPPPTGGVNIPSHERTY